MGQGAVDFATCSPKVLRCRDLVVIVVEVAAKPDSQEHMCKPLRGPRPTVVAECADCTQALFPLLVLAVQVSLEGRNNMSMRVRSPRTSAHKYPNVELESASARRT